MNVEETKMSESKIMPYVVLLRPGSASEAALQFELSLDALEKGTIEEFVNYGIGDRQIPQKDQVLVGRVKEEMKGGYGAQIGETVYRDPAHAEGEEEREHLITHSVKNRFKKADMLQDMENTLADLESKCDMDESRRDLAVDTISRRIQGIKDSGMSTEYQKMDIVVAHKLKGGAYK